MKTHILSESLVFFLFSFSFISSLNPVFSFCYQKGDLGHFGSKCTTHRWVTTFPLWSPKNLSNVLIKEFLPEIWVLWPLAVSLKQNCFQEYILQVWPWKNGGRVLTFTNWNQVFFFAVASSLSALLYLWQLIYFGYVKSTYLHILWIWSFNQSASLFVLHIFS